MLCPRTRRCMVETALVAPMDSRVSRAGSAGRRGVGPVLAYLMGVKWGRGLIVLYCVRACVLRCCVLVSRGVTLSLYAPVDGTSGVLVHLHLALSLPGLCAVRAVERCCLFSTQWRLIGSALSLPLHT